MILVTGANGVVGQPLLVSLQQKGQDYLAVSRTDDQERYLGWDMELPLNENQLRRIAGCTALIHCAPIWLLPQHLDELNSAGLRRMVVFSSTSVISKQSTDSPHERLLVERLRSAEQQLTTFAERGQLDLTILRPAMIYGYGRDQNVSHIAARIKRLKFMPLAGDANGLRQPVHADDLVAAALALLYAENTYGQTYTLAGAEQLSYAQMVERIFVALRMHPRMLSLPVWLYRNLLRLAAVLGRFDYTPAMANRMNEDLIYDNGAAHAAFGYAPQAFLKNPQRDLLV